MFCCWCVILVCLVALWFLGGACWFTDCYLGLLFCVVIVLIVFGLEFALVWLFNSVATWLSWFACLAVFSIGFYGRGVLLCLCGCCCCCLCGCSLWVATYLAMLVVLL